MRERERDRRNRVAHDAQLSNYPIYLAKVTSAKIGLPLFVAPVMDGPRLAAIEKVSVKIIDFADETETETKTETETVTELFLKVETVKRYNDTALVFLMANNQALFVWNGETVYEDANGTFYPVCEATATCAALYVDDNDEKEQLEEKAYAALEAGGFTDTAAGRRRLWHDESFCDVCEARQFGIKSKGTGGEKLEVLLDGLLAQDADFCNHACDQHAEQMRCEASANTKRGKGHSHRMTSVLTSTNDEELLRCLKSSSFMDCIERFD